ncbi:ATP-binding protein, partial [bacterium]|nr:ATP-binding protein [bacterium]
LLKPPLKEVRGTSATGVKIAINTNKILVEIQDTGKGIPEADLEEVFRADYTSPGFFYACNFGILIALYDNRLFKNPLPHFTTWSRRLRQQISIS